MAYNTKYFAYVGDASGNTYTVLLKKQNYSSGSTEITNYDKAPLVINYRGMGREDIDTVIYPSSVNFSLYAKSTDDFSDLLNSEYKDYQLEILKANYTTPVFNLISSTDSTDLIQSGAGRTWSLTGATATVSLNDSGNVSKTLSAEIDPLTDFKVVLNNVYSSGTLPASLQVSLLDADGLVQTSDSIPLISKSGSVSENQFTIIYSGVTPITKIEVYATMFSISGFPSTVVTWEDSLDIYQGSNVSTFWLGWLQPQNLYKSYVKDQYYLYLEANDGLQDLKHIEFPPEYSSGDTRLIDVVKAALEQTGIQDLDITDQLNISEANSTEPLLKSIYLDSRRFVDTKDGRTKTLNCYDTLSRVLDSFNCHLAQSNGKWTITQKNEKQSWIHSYDLDTLSGSTLGFDREIDISDYKIMLETDELSKIAPLKQVQLTFQNRNISESLLQNGSFANGTANWSNGTGATAFDGFMVNSGVLYTNMGGSDSNNTHYFRSANFSFEQIGTGNTLTVSIEARVYDISFSAGTTFEYYPQMIIELVYPNGISVQRYFEITDTMTRYSATFESEQDGAYYIKISIEPDVLVGYEDYILAFDNAEVVPVYESEDITFDRFSATINTGTTAVQRLQKTIYFADSENAGDLGMLKYSPTGESFTASWSNYDATLSNVPLTHLLAYNILRSRQRFKDYLRITLKADSSINFNSILNINGKKYSIVGFSHDLHNQNLELDLVEFLSDAIQVLYSEYTLLTVDGEGGGTSGGGTVTIEGVSEVEFDAYVSSTNSSLADHETRLDNLEAGGDGVTTIGTINAVTKSANGAVITGSTLFMQEANTSFPGLITTGSQSLAGAKSWTGSQTILSSNFNLRNPANTFSYTFAGAAIAANRTVTMPLLTGNDTLVTAAFSQTLTNKTLSTGTVFSVIPTVNDGIKFTFNPNATVAGLNVGAHTAAPSSLVNGDIWYNSTSNKFQVRENSATTNLIPSIGTINTPTKSANGGVYSGGTLYFQTADESYPGLVSTGAQTFAGQKTFTEYIFVNSATGIQGLLRNSTSTSNASLRLYNDQNIGTRALEIDYSGSGYVGSLLISGPAGESGSIATTGAYPLVLGTNNTARLTINSTGSVGIGISPTDPVLAFKTIQLGQGLTLMANTSGSGAYLASNTYYSSAWKYQTAAATNLIEMTGAGISFWTAPAGTADTSIPYTTSKLSISNSGNVGIGLDAPHAPLQFAAADANRKIVLSEVADNNHQFYGLGVGSSILRFQAPSSNFHFGWFVGNGSAASDELMRLTGGGSFGIGMTPTQKLDVSGGIRAGGASTASSGAGVEIDYGAYSNEGRIFAYDRTAGAYKDFHLGNRALFVKSTNEIGIGTANPQFPLDIQVSSGDLKLRTLNTGSGDVSIVLDRSGGSFAGGWSITRPSTSTSLAFHDGTADRFTFAKTGVGTATDWIATSDRRLKNNIEKVDGDVLEEIQKIGSLFSRYEKAGRKERGFIAQELLEVSPEYVVVPESPDEMMAVNYSKMTALLFKGFQQLLNKK